MNKRSKNRRWWVIGALAILLVFFLWPLFHKTPKVAKTIVAKRRDIAINVTAVGHLLPRHIITVRSALQGTVVHINQQVGDRVKKGDVLALVGPNLAPQALAQYLANVAQQEAIISGQQKQVANDRLLIKNKLATSNYSQYISDLAALKQSKAQLKYAKQILNLAQHGHAIVNGKLEQGQVVSPIDGYILQKNVAVGDTIISIASEQAATTLFTIANMHDIVFSGSVDEIDANRLKLGMGSTIAVAALSGQKIEGKLTRLGLQSNIENSKYEDRSSAVSQSPFNVGFEIRVGQLVAPKGVVLRSGFSATATMHVRHYKQVLTIPESALLFEKNKTFVLLPKKENKKFKRAEVKTGVSNGLYIQVVSGLKMDQKILADPSTTDG